MSVYARVKKIIKGGGIFGGDSTENYNMYIPETSDLNLKVDTSTLNENIRNVKTLISSEEKSRKRNEATVANSLSQINTNISKKADTSAVENKIKEITDCNRLAQEKAVLEKLFSEQITKIQNVCTKEQNKISSEIKAFQSIDLNKDLERKLSPLNTLLLSTEEKLNIISSTLKNMDVVKEEIAKLDKLMLSRKNEIQSISQEIDRKKNDLDNFASQKTSEINNTYQQIISIQSKITNEINSQYKKSNMLMMENDKKMAQSIRNLWRTIFGIIIGVIILHIIL